MTDMVQAIFEAPFGILAHDFSADGPPTFVYANQVSPRALPGQNVFRHASPTT